jgi:glycosyltransferase involved in cell wall biosynthesis
MLIHLFNSSSVCGPEKLVLPALAVARTPCVIVNLHETRISRLQERDPIEEYSTSLNLPYYAIEVSRRWDRQAISDLHDLLRRLKPELVHTHGIKPSAYLLRARRHSESHRIPIVATHHGVHGLPDRKVKLYEWIFRQFILKKVDRALAVSSADYAFLLKSGFNKSMLRLHLNGVDGSWVGPGHRPAESQKARALWLPKDLQNSHPFLFGVVARLSAEKDHMRLLRVLSQLNRLSLDHDWRCLIFGSGALESSLRQSSIDMGLENRILWMGYRKNVASELAGLDLLLSFSKAEGLPINLIEAGRAGTPVMCTRVGGVSDLIPDETYGQLIEPSEPEKITAYNLYQILSTEDRGPLEMQGRRFQSRVTQMFCQKIWLGRLSEIYSELGITFDVQASDEVARHSFDEKTVTGWAAVIR